MARRAIDLENSQPAPGPDPEAYIFGPHSRGNYDQLGLVKPPTGVELWNAYIETAAVCSSLACSAVRRSNFDLATSMLMTEVETILEDAA